MRSGYHELVWYLPTNDARVAVKLIIGRKVNYPSQGPCLIGPVVKRMVAGRSVDFYQLTILDDSGGELFIPVANAGTSGLRMLMKRTDIPTLLARLSQSATSAKDWKQRARENLRRLGSGSAIDLVDVVEPLTELSEKKELSFRETWMLKKARRLLVSEISEVMRETRTAAVDQIGQALKEPRTPEVYLTQTP